MNKQNIINGITHSPSMSYLYCYSLSFSYLPISWLTIFSKLFNVMKENRALKIADALFWMYYVASSLFYDHEDSCTRVSCKQMSWFAWVGLMPIFALLFHFVVPYSKNFILPLGVALGCGANFVWLKVEKFYIKRSRRILRRKKITSKTIKWTFALSCIFLLFCYTYICASVSIELISLPD